MILDYMMFCAIYFVLSLISYFVVERFFSQRTTVSFTLLLAVVGSWCLLILFCLLYLLEQSLHFKVGYIVRH